jgi:hypothetical protein
VGIAMTVTPLWSIPVSRMARRWKVRKHGR